MNVSPNKIDINSAQDEMDEKIEGQILDILGSFENNNSNLIPILQQIQQEFGYLPEQAMKLVADYIGVPESSVYGVATFYAFFKLVPSGRNTVRVCRGTACHVRGGGRILREVEKHLDIHPGESTSDLEYSLETVACIGACALAPTMVINEDTYGQMTAKKVTEVLKNREEGD